uniref:PREDICTED: serine/threonineprotein kinase CBK1like putative n=1 Tax=Albugo laibachii Nc14 TaxID=890382 RepID=F0W179_9STRA|nr:PREDICTED: serine/threonineprotein kinase CBK1like putative [Albugo laibachii Nc14]|eukprot:CCA14805.1 PREDICTED: serine/threonineprotein kinase CBK1like putative [Albugo laibachii Nc14]
MKIVSKQSIREKNLVAKILSERDILGGTQHPLLVHLHCAFQTAHDLLLVMEFCSGGKISAHSLMFGRFPERVARFYAAQLILAIEHLHRHGIVYRDLKPKNILLTGSGHLKLIDFGLSKFGMTEANDGASTLCGSWEYVAPDVLESCEYGSAVDWWSLGAVLYIVLTGLPPWYCENMKKMRQNILNCRLQFPRYISPEAQDLIRGLLVMNPSKRLGTTHGSMEIKQHPFFRNTDWEMICFQEVQPPMKPIEHDPSNVDFSIASLSKTVESTILEKPHDEFHDFDFMFMTISHIELGHTLDHGEKHVIVCRASMTSMASSRDI